MLKNYFLDLVKEKGGFKCHHAHFDKALLITPELLSISNSSLQEKWSLYRELKIKYTESDLYERISKCINIMLDQDVRYIKTFVDADSIVGMKCINAALEAKKTYSPLVKIDIAIQPLEGLDNKESRDFFVAACEKADVIGGLPDRDKSPEGHLRFIFELAKTLNKTVDIHVGQNNLPTERETELVLDILEELNLKQKVNLVHCISLSCQSNEYIRKQAKRMHDLNVSVIVCPSAAISMKQQRHSKSPIHNSIAPVNLLLEEDVDVKIGIDNISDLFMPLVDGDMWFESRLLMEAIRCYDLELISSIVSS